MIVNGDNPPAGAFEIRDVASQTSHAAFFENVQETMTEDGKAGWKWDEYTMPVIYRPGMENQIESNVGAWLSAAKALEEQALATQVRTRRNDLIAKCDFAMLPDAPTDKAIWSAYRQALRDVPEQVGFPREVVWPEEPV